MKFTIYDPLTPKMHQTKFAKNWPMACSFKKLKTFILLHDDDRRKTIAIGHLIDSGDLKSFHFA